jgi:hypothetical protein
VEIQETGISQMMINYMQRGKEESRASLLEVSFEGEMSKVLSDGYLYVLQMLIRPTCRGNCRRILKP